MFKEFGRGKDVVVMVTDQEMTPQQAADTLKISCPSFIKLLKEGQIPFRLVGTHRFVLLSELLIYREQEKVERHRGLDELVAEAQKLGMY
jgi:excisionase family DNA binding protein